MSNRTNISTITINAPASRVWEALTRPELVKQWQYGGTVITDWQKGSPIVFRNEWEGTVYEQKGTILEVEPGKMVRYSLFFPHPGLDDRPENYFTMTYRLEEAQGQTTLAIIQDDSREYQPQEQPAEEEENNVLNDLKKLVEGSHAS